ncbi:MAG: hypothetical protein ACRCYQ_06740 [Nocardioides sp.]
MSELEDLLRDDLTTVDRAVDIPPVPLGGVLERGHARRRRRDRALAGAVVVGGLALVTALSSVQWLFPGGESRSDVAGNPLADVRRTDAAEVAGRLAKARPVGDAGIEGTPFRAWSWRDRRGDNAMLMTRQTEGGALAGVPGNGTVRIYLGSELDTPGARVELAVVESNAMPAPDGSPAPCDLDGGIDFATDSVRVTDIDRDGLGEVSAGWWKLCAGDVSPASVNVVMMTGGQVFRLTGQGVPREVPPAVEAMFPPEGEPGPTATPEPDRAAWPAGTYARTEALFEALYR